MTKDQIPEFLEYASSLNPALRVQLMNPADAVFEENVKMNCYYCGKYGNNWRCPPNIPDLDYPKMFREFDQGAFVWLSYDITDKAMFDQVRTESSVVLHKLLLQMEKWMWEHNSPNALSFGAGSCKLCKGGCGKERCSNPYLSRTPLEATGVNVIKTARKYGIDIRFPTDEKLMRLGLLLWQTEEEEA